MVYDIPSIPTWYNGRRFRSRLEAKWQCFFDRVGWDAQYEPSEIAGYNPDFLIRCKSKHYPTKHIIVEVKPSIFINDEFKEATYEKYKNTNCHILILDDMPFLQSQETIALVFLGWGSQFVDEPYLRYGITEFLMKCNNDFSSHIFNWDGMIFGKIERKKFIDTDHLVWEHKELKKIWEECGNEVQFQVKNKSNG